jgi:hypothetical protein
VRDKKKGMRTRSSHPRLPSSVFVHCQWQSFLSRIQYTLEPVVSRLTLSNTNKESKFVAENPQPSFLIQNTDNLPKVACL